MDTIKMKRESMILCPKCKRLIAFDVDEALNLMAQNNTQTITLKCSWCGEDSLNIDENDIQNCKIIYKEYKE